jgi:hypothetical protein
VVCFKAVAFVNHARGLLFPILRQGGRPAVCRLWNVVWIVQFRMGVPVHVVV